MNKSGGRRCNARQIPSGRTKRLRGLAALVTVVALVLTTLLTTGAASAQQPRSNADKPSTEVITIYVSNPVEEHAVVGGTLDDARGNPVANIVVDLFSVDEDRGQSTYIGSKKTDAKGTYQWELEPGCYTAIAIAPGGNTFTNGARWTKQSVCVNAGAVRRDLDATFNDPTARSAAYGYIKDAKSVPVGDVLVYLFAVDSHGYRGIYLDTTTTDSRGRYKFHPAAGCYITLAVAPKGQTFRDGSSWSQTEFCVKAGKVAGPLSKVLIPVEG